MGADSRRNRSKGRGTWEPGARPGEGRAGDRASPANLALCSPVPRDLADGTELLERSLPAPGSAFPLWEAAGTTFILQLQSLCLN